MSELLPDRNDSDIPPQVQWFLSLCEMAVGWRTYIDQHIGEEQDKFCEGVCDYWWDYDTLEEPHFGQLFDRPLSPEEEWRGWPSQQRVAYQKGAIVGYQLAERFKDG